MIAPTPPPALYAHCFNQPDGRGAVMVCRVTRRVQGHFVRVCYESLDGVPLPKRDGRLCTAKERLRILWIVLPRGVH